MSSLWQRLVQHWRRDGLTIRPPVSPEAIQAFESRYNVVLPSDLRAFYLTVDGMEDEMDHLTNRFWPLEMLKPVFVTASDKPGRQLAPSFTAFVESYLADPASILI